MRLKDENFLFTLNSPVELTLYYRPFYHFYQLGVENSSVKDHNHLVLVDKKETSSLEASIS